MAQALETAKLVTSHMMQLSSPRLETSETTFGLNLMRGSAPISFNSTSSVHTFGTSRGLASSLAAHSSPKGFR